MIVRWPTREEFTREVVAVVVGLFVPCLATLGVVAGLYLCDYVLPGCFSGLIVVAVAVVPALTGIKAMELLGKNLGPWTIVAYIATTAVLQGLFALLVAVRFFGIGI